MYFIGFFKNLKKDKLFFIKSKELFQMLQKNFNKINFSKYKKNILIYIKLYNTIKLIYNGGRIMLGMNQIKKKMLIGFGIGLLIGLVIAGITITVSVMTVKSYENGTNKKYKKLFIKEVVSLKRDVIQGEIVKDEDIKKTEVHKNNAPADQASKSDVVGKIAKYNIPKNIPLVEGMFSEDVIAQDMRTLEYNTILMPSDLAEQDFVDVRVRYPSGVDYLVLKQKKVEKISNTTMWFNVNEEEMLLMNGAEVDAFINEGSKLYAVRYTDPEAQIKVAEDNSEEEIRAKIYEEIDTITEVDAETAVDRIYDLAKAYATIVQSQNTIKVNYMPNKQIMDLMVTRPNIVEEAKERLSEDTRMLMEAQLSNFAAQYEEEFGRITSEARNSIEAQRTEREVMLEKEEEAERLAEEEAQAEAEAAAAENNK